ncbi:site-specific integrase [Candidatus Marinimicrobia bacterium]|nr:site-specific integrase [Candidatus Neomarinimicrobiota bacterium]
MASIYPKQNGIYQLSIVFQGKRITKSLGTRSKETALKLSQATERDIYSELLNGKQTKDISFKDLVDKYLSYDHNWSKSTLEINTLKLTNYLRCGLPLNKTTKAMTIRIINGCNSWGVAQGYLKSYQKIPGGSNYDPRTRVYTKEELYILFNGVTPYHFNQFIQFAYYSGARIGEIRRISMVDVLYEYIVVNGKSGRRTVKLASQARKILDNNPQWDYTKNYVQLTWGRNRNRLGLKDARMHDLRRTFGYNLIKQGRPIYEVSKLLGHSSVVTTERHYAPLMATEIEEFVL